MPWLQLDQATILLDHDIQRAREVLQRGISKAWLTRLGGVPDSVSDPNVPLRIRVTPSPGWRIDGRRWLDQPVLHRDASEIECQCSEWRPMMKVQSSPPTQIRAAIEIWQEDIVRLWGANDIRAKLTPDLTLE